MKYLPFEKRHPQVGTVSSYAPDGSPVTRPATSLRLTGELIYRQRAVLAGIGAPVDYLLAEDLAAHEGKNYKLWIFLNCFEYDSAMLGFVEKLRERNNTLLWLYAPGLIRNRRANAENMKTLTGFTLREFSAPAAPSVELANGETMGLPRERIAPLFFVDPADDVKTIGRYSGGEAGLAEKATGKARSVFCGPYQLNPAFLRQLAAESGVHIFSGSGDVLEASQALVSLHARASGKKEIQLPAKADVVDVYQRKIMARQTDRFSFEAPLHSSWLFYYGDADRFLAEVK